MPFETYSKLEIDTFMDTIMSGVREFDERLKKLEAPPKREIVVTPQNFREKLTNISRVDFSGSNDEYVQVNRDHNMLAIPCDFENVEMEAEVFIVQNTGSYALQLQSRTYRHPGDSPANGAAYKARFRNTSSTHAKEVVHTDNPNGYSANRENDAEQYPSLVGRWSTLNFRTTNIAPRGDVIPVRLEASVDNQRSSWYEDAGGWSCTSTHFARGGSCAELPRRQYGIDGKLLSGNRRPDEIINTPLEWVIFRSDGDCVYRFRKLTVREI